MRTQRAMLVLGVALIVVAGCKPAPQPEQETVIEAPPPATDLEGTSWVAESVAGKPVAEGFESTVSFEADDRITGNAGCNGYFGSWGVDGDAIAFGHIGATMMMCPDEQMEQEQGFMEALNEAERFEVKDGKLFLFSPAADQITVLNPKVDEAGDPTDG